MARPPNLTSFSSYTIPKTMFHILSADPSELSESGRTSGVSTPARLNPARIHALRSEVIDGIEEVKDEIGQVDDQIAAQAEMQILPGESVMVHQPSRTVARFILKAASKRKFTVYVAGSSARGKDDEDESRAFKEKLASHGVKTVSVPGSGRAAYMPRVSKVIIGARAVVADGGVVVDAGAGALARAAKAHQKPVVVLMGVYKLSPESPSNAGSLIEWGAASTHVDFSNGGIVDGVEVKTTLTEFVPADLVDTYISNL